MTDSNYCCICASDEGVFLDIFTATRRQLGNRSFPREFEKCLSFKVKKDEALSSKICHKCAIELGECYQFVEKHHNARDQIPKLKKEQKSCCLCYSASPKAYLSTLTKEYHSTIDPLQKIRECLDEQITKKEAEKRSICLLCLYHLDVLYDLKILAHCVTPKLQQITERRARVENLPKTETFVVSRKTTYLHKSKVEFSETSLDTDGADTKMARQRLRSKGMNDQKLAVESKLRKCGQCHNSIEAGIDMFRLYTTGKVVCKMCWITTDPLTADRAVKPRRVIKSEHKNTKLCAVFLKDVLQNPGSPKNDEAHKITDNNIEDVISISSSSEDEYKPYIKKAKTNVDKRLRGKGTTSHNESNTNLKTQLKRSLEQENMKLSRSPYRKKIKINDSSTVDPPIPRRSTRNQSSDSDNVIAKSKQKNDLDVKPKVASKVKRLQRSNTSINSGDQFATSNTAGTSKSVDDSSGKGGEQKQIRKVRNKVPLISQPELTDKLKTRKKRETSKITTSTDSKQGKKGAPLKKLGVKSITKSSLPKPLAPSRNAKKSMPVSYPSKKKSYKCKICEIVYKNKIIGMKHELTHFKGVEIKIEKLKRNHLFQTPNENSPASSIIQESSVVDEMTMEPDVPSSDIHAKLDEDQDNESYPESQTAKSTPPSKKSVKVQGEAESVDVDPIQEVEVSTSPANELFEDGPISDASTRETAADKIVSEEAFGNASQEEIKTPQDEKKHTESEPRSTSESNFIADNDDVQVLNEAVERDIAEADKSVDNIEDENLMSQNNEAEAVVQSEKNARTDGDSGDELESDTDIRIVDTESSTEDSGERLEKQQVSADANEFFTPKITDSVVEELNEGPTENSEDDEISEETLNTGAGSDIRLISSPESNVERTDKTPKNGELYSEETGSKNTPQSLRSEVKVADQDKSTSVVTEILQEVIDLATAEVQKRAENNVIAVPETLENISKEITDTAGKSVDIMTSCANFETQKERDFDDLNVEHLKLNLHSPMKPLLNAIGLKSDS